jgi:hypothetical protein
MAPEAIINRPHDFCVDYFALGVIIYELMIGERPYQGKNRKEIKEQMFTLEIKLDNEDMPEDWEDDNILDLINRLLKRKKAKRLGCKGCSEIKNHPWFKDTQWDQIESCTLNSPFIFDSEDNFDDSYAQKQDNDSIYEGKKELYIIEVNESMTFKNFYFNIEEKIADKENNEEDNDNANIKLKRKETKKSSKAHTTSKSSNKKIGDDPVVIHNMKMKRKSCLIKGGIIPDSGNKIVNILRKDSKSGTMKLHLRDHEDK